MSAFDDITGFLDDNLWFVAMVLIVALGVYASIMLNGIQFTKLKEMIKVTLSFDKESDKDEVTPFHVFCISMGNRIGVGNLEGPLLAVITGGPGAIFWMWIFATLGGATSFIETTVGQLFKSNDSQGGYVGGPAYNVSKGLGMKKAGMAIAIMMVMIYVGGYVLGEVATISTSFQSAFPFENNTLYLGIVLAVLTLLVILGGFNRIAKASVAIVPLMAFGWIIICVASILLNFDGILGGLSSIFTCAFSVPSMVGGGIGAMLQIALQRGVWSNEAGEGTITNISSSAHVPHPAKQGLSQSFGVLVDTLISTMTALVILSAFNGDFNGIIDAYQASGENAQEMLNIAIGQAYFGIDMSSVIFLFVFLFAITCFMGDFVIVDNNMKFVTGSRIARILLIIASMCFVFLSAYYATDGLFIIMDILLAIGAIVNCVVMFKLGRFAVTAYKDYFKQKSEGKEDPVFHKSTLDDTTGVTEWDD